MLILTGLLFVVLVAMGMPVAFVFLAITGLWVVVEPSIMDVMVAQRLVVGTQSFPLLAVPLFILTGELMNISGITPRVMAFALRATRSMTGGLAKTNILLSTLLSGMSGSANGDAAMQSKILVPEMVRNGYPAPFSTALTAASALIAPLIPPGIGLILFGFVTNTSIGALFAAAVLPGLFLAAAMLVLVHFMSRSNRWDPARDRNDAEDIPLGRAFVGALPALLMPLLIIVGIRGGIFTPSEAGALAVAYTMIFLLVYREATWDQFLDALRSAIVSTSAIMLVLASSAVFTWILTYNQVPQAVGQLLLTATQSPQLMLVLIAVILLIAGMLVEGNALILVLGPMLMPVVTQLGVEPVHFGVVFIFMIHMGGITPPVGTVMFTTCAITRVKVSSFSKAILPFIALFLAVAGVLIFVPQMSTLLAGG